MTDYKELIERLRRKANLTEHVHVAREFRAAADAIEELVNEAANYEELWHQSMELRKEKSAEEKQRELKSRVDYLEGFKDGILEIVWEKGKKNDTD